MSRLVKRVTIYFCELSNKCFAANPNRTPIPEASSGLVATPDTKPYTTANITTAAVMFDTLALVNMSTIVRLSCYVLKLLSPNGGIAHAGTGLNFDLS